MRDWNTRARLDFEREQEKIDAAFSVAKAEQAELIEQLVDAGEMDHILYNYFDAPQLMRIARVLSRSTDLELDLSRLAGELIEIRCGIQAYIDDNADETARNEY